MKLVQAILVSLFCLFATTTFASGHVADSDECQYWHDQLTDIDAQIATAHTDLNTCDPTTHECSDLKQLIKSLKMEKCSTEDFINDFCQ